MAFTSCTNQFHFPKNGRKGLKLVSTIVLKNTKNKCTLQDVPLLPHIFVGATHGGRDPFTFQPNFPGTFS